MDVFLLSVKPAHFDTVWYPKADEDVKEKIMSVNPVIVDVRCLLYDFLLLSLHQNIFRFNFPWEMPSA